MAGHIALPEYVRYFNPNATKKELLMPATLNKYILTDLLRGKMGFNGLVVTDASHMVAMTSAMKRSEMLPTAIAAGSDMFLMPSLFEPCGLGQLIALRYGSIPIVRETGGLKDTISPYNKYNGVGNGFGFKNFNSNELMQIIEYALTIYDDKDAWNNIIRQAMDSDNSWEKSAMQYKLLYEDVVKRP